MSDAPALWTAEQQRWLAALGHTVWMQGALPEVATAEPAMQAQPAAMMMAATPPPAPAQRQFGAPAKKSAPPPSSERDHAPVTATPRRATAGLPDRLHMALIRASGINPNAPGMAEVIAQWPSPAELRGNPAAKRALWPRLRALRKQSRG
ncbi:MAG: alanine acetyltransferase [Pseudoxanthomonas sp.]